ncbi:MULTISPECIES: PucR family transcriptional regulator [unclassified Pseudomonas]|jgi:sugar diacid utilization regulator|uniref:PucR family transcriptional regulator n=1 Tax=unclassified Pseudomonas TaxID=196821 RepID=UPI0008CE7517|nr:MULTISPECIES: PucR family transcriptional regulator [unclassified Pseudomonas]PMV19215.1 PucR family transcriptional regulator [Pseudomonas sp. FW305-3-2-15-C-TSA2]PMV22888.1 PucR family transcriptional regulator [Pseudomonas sp. DP16D-L5]PMV35277.1 PucR family transcriptional regulator [Pseudomonas sp. FW305-3-2-15-A-LB2]PMV40555.1 PucR family transcriptional regulator [Pseudomonas sp. FW305-3-2-15-C-R2A1]PMV46071.1 PucR family transcriptional regulator [Pseudomonas sp. FW305-3-2-15-C-LB1]
MSLTIADVLALPGLESMRLRAGTAGLENGVRWPYVAENSGIAEWVLGGELVFVTGINHPRDEGNLMQLLEEACERQVAGLVILTGPAYIQAIPQRLLEAAEAAGMPLIEQPYSLKMVLVTQAIGSALIQSEQLGRSRHDVLERLLTGDYQSLDLLLHRGGQLGLSLAGHWQVVQLQLEGSELLFAQGDAAAVEVQLARQHDAINRRLRQVSAGLPVLGRAGQWTLLLPASDAVAALVNRQHLASWLNPLNLRLAPLKLFIGLSAAAHPPARLAQAQDEARQALAAARRFSERAGLCVYDELGVLKLLSGVRDRALLDQFLHERLGPLLRHDAQHGPNLMPTLEAWFHENGNLVAAAQRLAVHRNTLTHRVQRIEALCGLTLDNSYDRLDIGIALMIWRLSA